MEAEEGIQEGIQKNSLNTEDCKSELPAQEGSLKFQKNAYSAWELLPWLLLM